MSRDSRREILGMSKITYKFQVTIPKRVRERFSLKEGTYSYSYSRMEN